MAFWAQLHLGEILPPWEKSFSPPTPFIVHTSCLLSTRKAPTYATSLLPKLLSPEVNLLSSVVRQMPQILLMPWTSIYLSITRQMTSPFFLITLLRVGIVLPIKSYLHGAIPSGQPLAFPHSQGIPFALAVQQSYSFLRFPPMWSRLWVTGLQMHSSTTGTLWICLLPCMRSLCPLMLSSSWWGLVGLGWVPRVFRSLPAAAPSSLGPLLSWCDAPSNLSNPESGSFPFRVRALTRLGHPHLQEIPVHLG